MFCSGCGNQIQPGLNYCNHCGKRIGEPSSGSLDATRDITRVVGSIAVAAFIAYVILVIAILKLGGPSDQLIGLTFFYFGAMIAICVLLLHYARVPAREERAPENPVRSEPASPQYLRPPATAQLEEPRDQEIASVTDSTTRALDKVPTKEHRS